jgi:hypothetical protein
MNIQYPARPFPTGNIWADKHAMVEYRWLRARADYHIGCTIGAILPVGTNQHEIITSIYAAHLIADAQEGR